MAVRWMRGAYVGGGGSEASGVRHVHTHVVVAGKPAIPRLHKTTTHEEELSSMSEARGCFVMMSSLDVNTGT